MKGVITHYDKQKRDGCIKDTEKNEVFYFSQPSVADNSLQLAPGAHVKFDLLKTGDKTPVAVNIFSCRPKSPQKNMQSFTKTEHVNAVVSYFNERKGYGFVSCQTVPIQTAFLHQNQLKSTGLSSIKVGDHLKVRLGESKYPGKLAVVDVISIPDATFETSCKAPNFINHNMTRNESTKFNSQWHSKPVSVYHKNLSSVPRPSCNTKDSSIVSLNKLNHSHYNQQYRDRISVPKSSTTPQYFSGARGSNHSNLESIPTFSDPECAKINQQIQQKSALLKKLNIGQLPDGGKRIKTQIKELEAKLEDMRLSGSHHNYSLKGTPAKNLIDIPTTSTNKFQYDRSLYEDSEQSSMQKVKGDYYGGRMTSKRIDVVTQVTVDAIEKLHLSLETCPSSSAELEDPDGLLVKLMVHQRQALAWLVWREKQFVSGGILADDMGLGKTLTMISLILKQQQLHETEQTSKIIKEETDNEVSEDKCNTVTKQEILVKEEVNEVNQNPTASHKDSNNTATIGDFVVSESTLIIAPASLIYHWEKEIRNRCKKGLLSIHLYHGPNREKDAEKLSEFDVVITTYDIVRRCKPKEDSEEKPDTMKTTKPAGKDALFSIRWRRIILDEAHQIRNYKSQTAEAACSLVTQSRWALSGTPVQNQETDMYAMIKFLHCHPFDEYKLWKKQVSNKTSRGQKRLKTLVSSLVLRREKSQRNAEGKPLIYLPERTFKTHTLKLNDVEQEVYDKLKSESQRKLTEFEKSKQRNDATEDKLSATSLLVMLLRLRQCCGHLALLKNKFDLDLLEKEKQEIAVEDLFQTLSLETRGPEDDSFRQEKYADKEKASYFESSSSSSKIKFVMDTLHKLKFEQPDDKCVIISQWTSMLKILAVHLDEAKISYAVINGSVSARKRMDLVDDFNRNPVKPKIMLISIQAGGVGLNLIGGNHLFLLDMHWNPALEKQAFDRIYRVGQTKEVFVHKFVVDRTVEEKILKLQESKLAMAKAVMEGADVEKKVKLTLADMKILFEI